MKRFSLVGLVSLGALAAACGDSATDGQGGGSSSSTTSVSSGGKGGNGGSAPSTSASTGSTSSVTSTTGSASGGAGGGSSSASTSSSTGGQGGAPACGTPVECAAIWEQNASDHFDQLIAGDPSQLPAYFAVVPKGGDLHNHLTGAVYAETYLGWAKQDGDCINQTSYSSVYSNQCSATNLATPSSGAFYDSIVKAWSMKDFVAGTETGHDHFFATFGKYGAVAGAHRNDDLADIAIRAASENQLYIETMFNLGKNVGDLSASLWSGTLTQNDLETLYDKLLADSTFQTKLTSDVAVVNQAKQQYLAALGCSGANPPAACSVEIRFIAQVSRTGAKDEVFGQLVSAFEMAEQSPNIVGANLSSPEDDTTSINAYALHMQMLDFLHTKYKSQDPPLSPLHITLHAGELTAAVLPQGSTANTFHIRDAVAIGHAERIGHGIDIMSETDPAGIMASMASKGVLVEACLSSNAQILNVSGAAHPLPTYVTNGVPVALGTDDEGVSRSSMAGEYLRAATDLKLSYRQLKRMARDSLEHAFLPGASLWSSLADDATVTDCAPTDTMGVGDTPNATCQAFLGSSEKARMQWELEHRFLAFESKEPAN